PLGFLRRRASAAPLPHPCTPLQPCPDRATFALPWPLSPLRWGARSLPVGWLRGGPLGVGVRWVWRGPTTSALPARSQLDIGFHRVSVRVPVGSSASSSGLRGLEAAWRTGSRPSVAKRPRPTAVAATAIPP